MISPRVQSNAWVAVEQLRLWEGEAMSQTRGSSEAVARDAIAPVVA